MSYFEHLIVNTESGPVLYSREVEDDPPGDMIKLQPGECVMSYVKTVHIDADGNETVEYEHTYIHPLLRK